MYYLTYTTNDNRIWRSHKMSLLECFKEQRKLLKQGIHTYIEKEV